MINHRNRRWYRRMSERIGNEKIVKDMNYLYYIGKDGYVWASPRNGVNGEKKKVGTEKISKERGYLYFIGKEGYVCRAVMKNVK